MVSVVTHLTKMLEPIATSHGIRIYFRNKPRKILVNQDAATLITCLTELLYKIINYTSENNEVCISLEKKKVKCESILKILIENTGTNLSRVTELTSPTLST